VGAPVLKCAMELGWVIPWSCCCQPPRHFSRASNRRSASHPLYSHQRRTIGPDRPTVFKRRWGSACASRAGRTPLGPARLPLPLDNRVHVPRDRDDSDGSSSYAPPGWQARRPRVGCHAGPSRVGLGGLCPAGPTDVRDTARVSDGSPGPGRLGRPPASVWVISESVAGAMVALLESRGAWAGGGSHSCDRPGCRGSSRQMT
jgi:hypothetical protein